jgi:hypothetical protein
LVVEVLHGLLRAAASAAMSHQNIIVRGAHLRTYLRTYFRDRRCRSQ